MHVFMHPGTGAINTLSINKYVAHSAASNRRLSAVCALHASALRAQAQCAWMGLFSPSVLGGRGTL
jgi:hypothetical protein